MNGTVDINDADAAINADVVMDVDADFSAWISAMLKKIFVMMKKISGMMKKISAMLKRFKGRPNA